jgi:hypothetical protein
LHRLPYKYIHCFLSHRNSFRTSSSTSSAAISAGILDLCDNIYHLETRVSGCSPGRRLVLFRHRSEIRHFGPEEVYVFLYLSHASDRWKSPSQPLHYTTVRFMFG